MKRVISLLLVMSIVFTLFTIPVSASSTSSAADKFAALEKNGSAQLAYKNGKTGYSVYRWGLRIYISKSAIDKVTTGISIASIWITKTNLIKILGTAGIVLGKVKGGIVFDFQPAGFLTVLIPSYVIGRDTNVITNVHYQ